MIAITTSSSISVKPIAHVARRQTMGGSFPA
jgi:hypothetical protein